MQHKMIPLFSVPLIKTNIGAIDQIAKAWIRDLDYPHQSTGTDHSDDHLPEANRGMHILDRPQLSSLKHKIKEAVDYFVKDVLGINEQFKITTSWINRNGKDEHIHKHSHPNSIFSGVYYVDVNPQSSPIIFEKPYLYTNIAHQSVQLTYDEHNKNQYNTDYYGIHPAEGELLMFPSWLEHTVLAQESEVHRISLAFNTYPQGDIGSGTKQLKL